MPKHTKRNLIIGAAALAVAAGLGVATPANPQGAEPRTRRYGLNLEVPEEGAQSIVIANTGDPSIARSAGVQPGDHILAVNGVVVSEMPREQVAQAMRASPVTLRLRRGSEEFDVQMSLD